MIDYISNIVSQAYDNPATSSGKSKVVLSMLSKSNVSGNGIDKKDLSGVICNTTSLKPLLKDYPLTKLIVNIFSSTIGDILGKTPFEIKITKNSDDHKTLQKAINGYLADIKFKDFILNNLDDALYEGSCASYSKLSEDGKWINAPIKCKNDLLQVLDNGEIKWYYVKEDSRDDNSYATLLNRGNNPKVIDSKFINYFSFDPRPVKQLCEKEFKKNQTNGQKFENTFENNYIVRLQYLTGSGICDDILSLLFEHMLLYLMRLLLSIKNAIRPDIMMARIDNSEESSITQIGEALRHVEAMLNNNANQVDFRISDPSAILSMIYTSVLNSVKVVPSIATYTEMEKLEYPDLLGKLQNLMESQDLTKRAIGNHLGIPEEIFEGTSNRWEVVSRSSRFLTAINSKLLDISRCVKDKVIEYAKTIHGKVLTYEDLELTLDTTNIIFNSEYNSKQVLIADKVGSISRILSDAEGIVSTGVVEKNEFYKWLKKQLQTLDPEIPNYIDIRIKEQLEQEQMMMEQQGQEQ